MTDRHGAIHQAGDRRGRSPSVSRWATFAAALGAAAAGCASTAAGSAGSAGSAGAAGAGAVPSEVGSAAGASFARAFLATEGSALGTAVIWLLLALSVVTMALLGTSAWRQRRDRVVPRDVVEALRRASGAGRADEVAGLARRETSDVSRLVAAASAEAGRGIDAMLTALEQAAEDAAERHRRPLEIVAVIGQTAPMLGLFGTVYGMILAFRTLVAAAGAPDPVELAAGISTALVTTFWGLAVAIPAVAGQALLAVRIDGRLAEAERIAEGVVRGLAEARSAPAARRAEGSGS